MSSTPPRNRRFPSIPVRAGTSTAQAGLAKIINLIITVPPPPLVKVSLLGSGAYPDSKEISTMPGDDAVNLDLRLGLTLQSPQAQVALAPANGVDDQNSTAHSGVFDSDGTYTVNKIPFNEDCVSYDIAVADKSSEGECSLETKPIGRRSTKIMDVTWVSRKDEGSIGGKAEARVKKEEEKNKEGYLDLLLDAALLVSSEGWNDAVRRKRSSSCEMHRSKRARTNSASAVGLMECKNTDPITRSKRGRALVLPSRYRDSILDPCRKAPTVQRR